MAWRCIRKSFHRSTCPWGSTEVPPIHLSMSKFSRQVTQHAHLCYAPSGNENKAVTHGNFILAHESRRLRRTAVGRFILLDIIIYLISYHCMDGGRIKIIIRTCKHKNLSRPPGIQREAQSNLIRYVIML